MLRERNLVRIASLENNAALAFADIEYNGLDMDVPTWKQMTRDTLVKIDALKLQMDHIVESDPTFAAFIPKYVQGDLFGPPARKLNINWTSAKQAEKIFQTIVPDLKGANADVLHPHRNNSLVYTYIRFKELCKVASSYGESFLDTRKGDGRIHTSFSQILNTGRVSSKDPNMQQIPQDNRFRNCFLPPEGHVFVSGDYDSQELNIIAYGSQDPVWLAALEKGEDLHSTCAALVYGKKWTSAAEDDCAFTLNKQKCDCKAHKALRTNVKTINFG